MLWHQIPAEMRDRAQWVCADDDKQPRNARTGLFAKVDDPTTWSTFAEATKAAIANGWDIGFVLSVDDPYTIVDLDDKPANPATPEMRRVHADILANSDTYIERSTSGSGYHLVMVGECKRPIKTPHIEQYSSLRFMICTGDVVKDLPIVIGQSLIDRIDEHFGHMSVIDTDVELLDQVEGVDELPDSEVIERGKNAENGDKFTRLFEGDLNDYEGDHSRADSALLNLLCFLTPHNEQVRRIFRASGLYRPNQRNRTTNKYFNYSIHKWRAENPPLDLSEYSLDIEEGKYAARSLGAMAVAEQMEPEPDLEEAPLVPKVPQLEVVPSIPKAPPVIPVAPSIPSAPAGPLGPEFPPGIIGDIARYSLATSYNPIPEGSLAAAIGYCAGLVGRGYHINKLGLNQYLIFIADSGVGKEGGKRAIRAIHAKVYEKVPASMHAIGSSDFSAGVSMVKELAEQPCMLGVAGEIGMTLRVMLDPRAPGHIKELKRALTDAWSESGPNGLLNSRKYSDRSKNNADVKRPCLSLLGESVPSHFYGSLSDETANDGFIPRFVVMEYKGQRPFPNRDGDHEPPAQLVERLTDLFVASKTLQDSNSMLAVAMDDDAKKAFHQFEDGIIERVRALPVEHPVKSILNRTNEKALKLAGLLAVCDNPFKPRVTLAMATWAVQFIQKADSHMVERFESGEIGEGEQVFDSLVRKAIKAFQKMTDKQKLDSKVPKGALGHPVIPHSYLYDYLKRKSEIKGHRGGMSVGIKVAIEEALLTGVLVKIPSTEKAKIGLRADAYVLGEGW